MFEEEAEEYAENREVCDLLVAISEDLQNYDYGTVARYNIDPLVEECFKDGAEFGYNKAKEELEKENVKLRKIAEFQQSSNMDRGFQLQRSQEKLTKAKKLIEKLLIVSCNSEVLIQYPNCKEVLEARVALELFLREIKEK